MKDKSAHEILKTKLGAGPAPPASQSRASLINRYLRVLRDYLSHRDKKHLRLAREIGGLALHGGLGVFDLACLHEEVLAKMIEHNSGNGMAAWASRTAEVFLLEALTPFETARRGLPQAYVHLGQLKETLAERNQALAIGATRERLMAKALRSGQERYFELSRQARSMQADIRLHSARLHLALEEERKRVSRELHDEIGQALAAVNVGLAMLKKQAGADRPFQKRVVATQALLEKSMESVHRFALGLRPKMLDQFGPYEAIRSYVKAYAERMGIRANIQAKADLTGLDDEQDLALFRVAQECITNISKHARATRIDIRFQRDPKVVTMEIQDNGQSFSVSEKLQRNNGQRLGLLGMQERVRLVRGNFFIESSPGRGTKVRVQFPVRSDHGPMTNGNSPDASVGSSVNGVKAIL